MMTIGRQNEFVYEIQKYVDDIDTCINRRKREKLAEAMSKRITSILDNHPDIDPALRENFESVRSKYSVVPITKAQKAVGSCSRRNKADEFETLDTRWYLADDAVVELGQQFQKEVSGYRVSALKLHTFLIGKFCDEKGELTVDSTSKERTITVSLDEFMQECGLVPMPGSGLTKDQIRDKRKNALRIVHDDFKLLSYTRAELERKAGRKRQKARVSMFGDYDVLTYDPKAFRGSTLKFYLTEAAAAYFTKKDHLKTFHNCLYQIGTERAGLVPNVAFMFGLSICEHAYMYQNHPDPQKTLKDQKKPTYDRLSVRTLVNNSPLYGAETGKDPRRTFVTPFFEALDTLVELVPFLKEYTIVRNGRKIPIEAARLLAPAELMDCVVHYQIEDMKDISAEVRDFYTRKRATMRKRAQREAKRKEANKETNKEG